MSKGPHTTTRRHNARIKLLFDAFSTRTPKGFHSKAQRRAAQCAISGPETKEAVESFWLPANRSPWTDVSSPTRYTFIDCEKAEANLIELLWNAPVSETKLSSQLRAMDLADGDCALDVGCGCGEVLIRICEQHAIDGTGIDSSPDCINEARKRLNERAVNARPRFIEADAKSWSVEAGILDAVICLGASHAFGFGPNAYPNALQQLITMIRPGGQILISEGYAKQPIPAGYRDFIGDSLQDDNTHESNVETGTRLGLVVLGAWTSSNDEWDEFEWSYQRVLENRARSDKQVSARLLERRKWMKAYLRWGRDTLGYGTYLFRKPESDAP